AGNNGKRWTYDASGLAVQEETLDRSVAVESTFTTLALLRGAEQPVHRTVVDRAGATTSESTWTYDAQGVLLAVDGWGIVSGNRRTHHEELDAHGRETRFVEETEEPTCHRFERTSSYAAAGDADPAQQDITCD